MLKSGTLYYFSPTGGTKKVSDLFCHELFEQVEERNLGKQETIEGTSEIVVFAVPVFFGRVPDFVAHQLKKISGNAKKAITLVVYGNRHYNDALLELNTIVKEIGFQIIASAALLAQHSVVPNAGKGRPDTNDVAEIQKFASDIKEKINCVEMTEPKVPGNVPYCELSSASVTPINLDGCTGCGKCAETCPVNAITIDGTSVTTNADSCFLCMGCTSVCPMKIRILPPPVQTAVNEELAIIAKDYRPNEFFLG